MSERKNKPRVLAQFEVSYHSVRIVDLTNTEDSRTFRVQMEQRDGCDAMGASRWVDIVPRKFEYTSNGVAQTLRYYSEGDVRSIVDALSRKLRSRRRRSKKGGAA